MKYYFLFVLKTVPVFILLCLSFSLFACAPPKIWEVEEEEFRRNLAYGRYNFLRHIDYEKAEASEILRLGKGAGFYMHFVFLHIGMTDLATEMLRQEWIHGEGMWKQEAGKLLISRLIEQEEFDEARREALLFTQDYPDSYIGARLLLESVYWKRESAEVLDWIEKLEPKFPREVDNDPEILLFRAVSKSRLDLSGWGDDFVTLFTTVPASGYHIRAFRYIEDAPALSAAFTEEEQRLLNAKMWFATENYHQAADTFAVLLNGKSRLLLQPVIIGEVTEAFRYTERQTEGETLIREYMGSRKPPAEVLQSSLFSRGLLLRDAGAFPEAALLFREARQAAAGEPGREDRCLWYELDCRYKQGIDEFLEAAESASEVWHKPNYFSDLFERAGADLTARRRWHDIWETFQLLQEHGDPAAAARYGYISFRAAEEGLLRLPAGAQDRLLEQIAETADFGYYPVLAGIRSGRVPDVVTVTEGLAPEETSDPEGGKGEKTAEDETAQFVKGFFPFSLHEEAFIAMQKYEEDLDTQVLRECGAEFSELGFFRESIAAANAVWKRLNDGELDPALRAMLFPRAFIHEIKLEAEKNDIPWYVLAALIREESHFDPEAVSRAGALGLSQLMPATAEETARRLGIAEPDIFDPSANLSIGAYYFGTLLRRFDGNPSRAVFAYNAGPTRMRRWEGRFRGLPGDLLLEAVPIEETRNHGRKVLVSALVYGYIYEGKGLSDIVSQYFTGEN